MIDPVEVGLEMSEDFVPLDEVKKKKKMEEEEPHIPDNSTYHPGVNKSQQGNQNPYGEYSPIQDETVNIQGNYNGLNAGGTRIM